MTTRRAAAEPDARHGLGRVEFIVLSALISTTIAISIDTILPAFSEMEDAFDLGASGSSISLSITVFLIALGAGMIVWGPLSDRYGRKPTMYASLALFVAGALLSTFAGSFPVFLAGRFVWGIGAAGPRTVGLAIVRDSYDGDLMSRIMTLTSAVFLLVPVVAPGLGELMLLIGSWRLTTAVGAGLGVVTAVWFTRIHETLDPADARPFELSRLTGAARSVVTNRTTMTYTLATTMTYAAFFPWLGSSVQMIDDIYGRPDQFALLFGGNAIVMAGVIVSTERLVARYGTYRVALFEVAAMTLVGLVYVVVARGAEGVPTFWVWFGLTTLMTALNAGVSPLTQTMSLAPMGRIAGMASSVTGALIFSAGAALGGLTDSLIVETVTPFGVGFLIYGLIAIVAIASAKPTRPA